MENTTIDTLQIGMEWFPEAPGSGVARMFHGLVQHLPAQGCNVRGLVTGNGRLENGPHSVHAFSASSAPLPARLWHLRNALRRHTRELAPDLLAAHFSLYALPALAVPHDLPFVFHFHGPWALESKAEGEFAPSVWCKRQVERLVYSNAHRFIVLSEAFAEILVDEYGVSRDDIQIVPGGVEVDRFDTPVPPLEARKRLGWPTDRPIIFSVRRLVRRVGLEQLIQAMEHVSRHIPEICLLIAGKGPLASVLKKEIKDRDLTDHVTLLGFLPEDDLPLAYRAADYSIVPTRSLEGFGLVAVESLAAGTPVLVTPVGGLPEVVRDLSSNLVMEGTSSDALRNHLIRAFEGDLNVPSADACREFAASRYDWPVVAQQVRSVYEELL